MTVTIAKRQTPEGSASWRLPADATVRFRPAANSRVHCDVGTLLVTQEGDLQDHVLKAGDAFAPTRRGAVVAWALSDAVLTLEAA